MDSVDEVFERAMKIKKWYLSEECPRLRFTEGRQCVSHSQV